MATASRSPSNSLDERLFPPIQMLERPVAERPQHDTLEGIMDWLAGPAQQVGVPSLIGEFDEFAWRMLAAGFPLLRATLQLRTLHPQILEQTSFGGERPVGPSRTTSRMKRRICMAMRIIRSEEYLWVDRRFDAELMCPTISSIFPSFTI